MQACNNGKSNSYHEQPKSTRRYLTDATANRLPPDMCFYHDHCYDKTTSRVSMRYSIREYLVQKKTWATSRGPRRVLSKHYHVHTFPARKRC